MSESLKNTVSISGIAASLQAKSVRVADSEMDPEEEAVEAESPDGR